MGIPDAIFLFYSLTDYLKVNIPSKPIHYNMIKVWNSITLQIHPSVHYYVHPLGGGHIIFAFSGVRRPTWFPDILGNSSYPIFTKFGMQVYWVNSLCGIDFGDDSSIAN